MKKQRLSPQYADKHIQFGLNVALYREQADMTQEQLAERAGISRAYLRKIEAPNILVNVTVETMFDLAKAIGLSPSKLLEFRD
ncbi:MAG: helix-turn-helix domain-containing protein [Clostridia bacterium]|nr:helix-turn-helix domain-containing protein [Clostridia bacterium]